MTSDSSPGGSPRAPQDWEAQVAYLEREVTALRRRLADAPGSARALEQRLSESQRSLAGVTAQNERLAQPPSAFGVFLQRNEDDTVHVFTSGRKRRVSVSPNVELDELRKGQEVM